MKCVKTNPFKLAVSIPKHRCIRADVNSRRAINSKRVGSRIRPRLVDDTNLKYLPCPPNKSSIVESPISGGSSSSHSSCCSKLAPVGISTSQPSNIFKLSSCMLAGMQVWGLRLFCCWSGTEVEDKVEDTSSTESSGSWNSSRSIRSKHEKFPLEIATDVSVAFLVAALLKARLWSATETGATKEKLETSETEVSVCEVSGLVLLTRSKDVPLPSLFFTRRGLRLVVAAFTTFVP